MPEVHLESTTLTGCLDYVINSYFKQKINFNSHCQNVCVDKEQ